jgi:hypothetical protein
VGIGITVVFTQKGRATAAFNFFVVRPAGRTHLGMKVPYAPGKGKRQLDGKGVHREVESEGSRKQNAGSTNRKRIRGDHVG